MRILFLVAGFLMSLSSHVQALDIVTIEQPAHQHVLKTKAQAVRFPLSESDKNLISAMKDMLYRLHGVGLAAPQVNHSRQIIVIYIPEDAALLRDKVTAYPMHVLCNPSYEAVPGSLVQDDFEGCYSVATKSGKVPRYQQIKLSYYDEKGQRHEQLAQGFYARVLQHEIDHLNGILIVDRLTPDCVQGTMEEMMALRRAELPKEKRKLFDQLMAKKMEQ